MKKVSGTPIMVGTGQQNTTGEQISHSVNNRASTAPSNRKRVDLFKLKVDEVEGSAKSRIRKLCADKISTSGLDNSLHDDEFASNVESKYVLFFTQM